MLVKIVKGAVFIVVAAALILFLISRSIPQRSDYSTDISGLLQYPEDRKLGSVRSLILEENNSYTLKKVVFTSRNKEIYGLFFMPKGKENVPGVIMLPGARGVKENHLGLGKKMAAAGYAFLSIDQRGIGETDGSVPSMQEDYNSFVAGNEPVQGLFIYDALKSFDFMRSQDEIDSSRIVIAGESMGGRFAMVAAALDKRVKGALVFSTAGFGKHNTQSSEEKFYASMNPDMYLYKLAGRKLSMFHAVNDSVIPYANAQATFSMAPEPKHFVAMQPPCDHGYCAQEYDNFIKELEWIMNSVETR